MSTSAVAPVSGVTSVNPALAAAEQSALTSVLSRLQQSIASGDLSTSETLLNAINAISPTSAGGSDALGNFLSSLATALGDQSVSEAQSALAAYQSAVATAPSGASSSVDSASARETAEAIASQLIQTQNQLLLATALANLPNGAQNASSQGGSSSNSVNSLYALLSTALGSHNGTSSPSPSSASSTSPYDTLVNAIQASLAAGNGALTPSIAYLQANGNFVNTSA